MRLRALEAQVRRTLRRFAMVAEGDHVVAGVSGGADSMAMLHCLVCLAPALRLTLTVAHLNHGIRGAEAGRDQEFVRRAGAGLGLPFVTETVRLKTEGEPGNMEELARRARYDFLRRTAAQVRAHKIAVGHTLNDQAETVLLRVFRGSGPDGLAAIHPVVDNLVIRPLLECTRNQVVRYLDESGIDFLTDSTNRLLAYRRNRVRHELVPYLEANFNPRVVESLARTAALSREAAEFLDQESRREYDGMKQSSPGSISLPIERILRLHPAVGKLVVRQAFRESRGRLAGLAGRHVEEILLLCRGERSGRRILLPGAFMARRQFDNLILQRMPGNVAGFCRRLPVPGICAVPEAGTTVVARVLESAGPADPGGIGKQAILDRDRLPDVLMVRSRLPGDRYGGPGSRKVKKMLIDARIPVPDRETLPMIAAGDRSIAWIPGFKPANSFAVHPNSSRFILLEIADGADP